VSGENGAPRNGKDNANHRNNKSGFPTKNSNSNHALGLLDQTNKRIISLIEKNVAISQTEIAKELGLSQSSIALRLEKIKGSGLVREDMGIAFKKLGLQLCRVDMSSSDVPKVLEWARLCPLLVNGTVGVGNHNVTLYFVAEDLDMFQQIIDDHVRKVSGVSQIRFSPIVSWVKEFAVSVPLDVKVSDTPPCGVLPYCSRCPANPNYDGKIWDGGWLRQNNHGNILGNNSVKNSPH
jgi:DNA-binding Lrp family transcriptional regulator